LFDFIAQCTAAIDQQSSLIIALFFAGLTGGFTHCVGMCSPFVITQVTAQLSQIPANNMRGFHRLKGAALIPYHLGRMTTYAGLGAMSAFLSAHLMALASYQWIAAALLALAACIFLITALKGTKLFQFLFRNGLFRKLVPNFSVLAPKKLTQSLFRNPIGLRGYALGIVLGFIPCGLIFAALLAVSAIGKPLDAAIVMIFFTIGTVPALFFVGISSHFLLKGRQKLLHTIARMAMITNSMILFFMAGELIL